MKNFTCRVCGCTQFEIEEARKTVGEPTFIMKYFCAECGVIFKDPKLFSLPEIKIKKLTDTSKLPKKSTSGSIGYDLYSNEILTIKSKQTKIVKTGIAIELPINTECQIRSRSGLASKGIMVANGIGTIDQDYRGEIGVILYNSTSKDFKIDSEMRIAQLVFTSKTPYILVEEKMLDETKRGKGGFGSTGK